MSLHRLVPYTLEADAPPLWRCACGLVFDSPDQPLGECAALAMFDDGPDEAA